MTAANFGEIDKCRSEGEIKSLLESLGEWENHGSWKKLSTGAITSNASGTAQTAMAELTTNATDAVSEKFYNEEIERNPSFAPRSPSEMAIAMRGMLYENGGATKQNLPYLLVMLKGGSDRNKLSFSVYDRGCGRNGKEFENSFLKVGEEPKKDKPYLHGKHGMGSSGTSYVSGKLGFRLIISRSSKSDSFLWTLIRRNPFRLHELQYYAPNGKMREWNGAVAVPKLGEKDFYEIETGTMTRIYDLDLKNNTGYLDSNLGSVLSDSIFPIRMLEERTNHGSDPYDTRIFHSLRERAFDLAEEGKAERHSLSMTIDCLGTFTVESFCFMDRKSYDEIKSRLVADHRSALVFGVVNGQTQFVMDKSILTIHHPNLTKCLSFVHVSEMDQEGAKAYLLKSDRLTFLNGSIANEFKARLADYFARHHIFSQWEKKVSMSLAEERSKSMLEGASADDLYDKLFAQKGKQQIRQMRLRATISKLDESEKIVGADGGEEECVGNESARGGRKSVAPVAVGGRSKGIPKGSSAFVKKTNGESFAKERAKVSVKGSDGSVKEVDDSSVLFEESENGVMIAVSEEFDLKNGERLVVDLSFLGLDGIVRMESVEFGLSGTAGLSVSKGRGTKNWRPKIELSYCSKDGRVFNGNSTNKISDLLETLESDIEMSDVLRMPYLACPMDSEKFMLALNVDCYDFTALVSLVRNSGEECAESWLDQILIGVMSACDTLHEMERYSVGVACSKLNDVEKAFEIRKNAMAQIRRGSEKKPLDFNDEAEERAA